MFDKEKMVEEIIKNVVPKGSNEGDHKGFRAFITNIVDEVDNLETVQQMLIVYFSKSVANYINSEEWMEHDV